MITFNAVGRLTKDCEVKVAMDDSKFCLFNLACDGDRKKVGDKWETETTFISCVFFRADKWVPYLTKGKKIAISGDIIQQKWKDEQGNEKSTHRFRIQRIEFCEKRESESEYSVKEQKPVAKEQPKTPDDFEDKMPF